MESNKIGTIAIALVLILGFTGVLLLDPIAQDTEYHLFKDQRTYLGIPNFWNVVSNFPFLLVGCMGIYSLFHSHRMRIATELKTAYTLFFLGVTFVAFGSAYYHLWPSNNSLVWDRLPMTIAFMSLFSIIIGEFTSIHIGKRLLWPLIIFGVFSVIYWYITERNDAGDLRLYILVQFLPALVIPIFLLFFKPLFTNIRGYWFLIIAYVAAKIFEHFDAIIYNVLVLFSGHSIKHVVATLGVYFLVMAYNNRELV